MFNKIFPECHKMCDLNYENHCMSLNCAPNPCPFLTTQADKKTKALIKAAIEEYKEATNND